jgi:hypothetical protein
VNRASRSNAFSIMISESFAAKLQQYRAGPVERQLFYQCRYWARSGFRLTGALRPIH